MQGRSIEFIYWFAYFNLDSPSVRYRGKYPLDFFKEHNGINSFFVVPDYSPRGIIFFLKAYFSALFFRKKNSLIVIQRVQSDFIYANLLKLLIRIRNHDTVYDLDDADYLEVNPQSIHYFARHCEKISAGSRQIETYLKRFNHRIVHTSSPIVDLGIVRKSKNTNFTIGWIGGFGGDHKRSLIDLVFPAMKELTFPFKVVILGVQDPNDAEFIRKYFKDNPNIEIEIPLEINWNDEAGLQKRIVLFDVGIATLANNQLQLSKSGIKVKQYMNNGVPVLSTDLPENNSVVVDGVNGYYCTMANDFKQRLIQFYHMPDAEYLRFLRNARKSICNFDHNKYLSDFEKIKNDI